MNNEEYFGEVRWCKDDVICAMDLRGIPLTEENIVRAVTVCANNNYLRDGQIERGWEIIDYLLGDEFVEKE